MKNNQYIRQAQYKKGFANMVLIGVIVILLGVIGYFVFIKKPTATQPITETQGITIEQPTMNQEVQLPITVKGYINGNGWTAFEGVSGSVQVFDANNKVVSERVPLQATTDWMKPIVYFETSVGDREMMSNLATQTGVLVFKSEEVKDESNVKEFRLPIKFAKPATQIDSLKFESEIITSLKSNWQSIQTLIPFRPGHPGTTAWLSPHSVQFIGENNLLVGFEDGYNPGIAVLNFDGSKFKILETFKNQGNFTLLDWQNLVKKYGDLSYSVSTYTISLLRNKEIVSFQNLTKVPENIFLKNY